MVVYHVDKKLNGANDQVLDTIRIILPNTFVSASVTDLILTEGDSIPFPNISVTPLELSNKSLTFTSSAPALLFVGNGYLRAIQRGTANLNVSLNSNPTKSVLISVFILPNPLTPDRIKIQPDTLRVAANGATGSLTVQAAPSSADASVSWSIADTSIARFTVPGTVKGLIAGQTLVIATSNRKPTVKDSSLILVQAPVAVASVRFLKDSLDLFVGGAIESLTVAVLPALANPMVDFSILNPALVSLNGGRVQGLTEGKTKAIAKSSENPAISDTLDIVVMPTQKIDSVNVSPDSVKLYTGGAPATLTGKVYPATVNQSVLWKVRNETLATATAGGGVSARAVGRTFAIGYSRVDSTKKDSSLVIVKRDMPQLSVGRDTVLAIGATLVIRPTVLQEYGSVVRFSWDGNGDGTFEGVSDSLKAVSLTFMEAKETITAFTVKDSEGNDTTVYKKVKAVAGPAVQIVSPLDSTYTRMFSIDVIWIVNGKEQDSLRKQALKLGSNMVSRSAKDEAGNIYSATVTVIVDTTPPNKPVVRGPAVSGSKTPTWTWATGGGGVSGNYKYWVDVDDSSKGKATTDTSFTPATDLAEGAHTLFVTERDRAGNWSSAGKFTIKIDLSAPGMPKVTVTPTSPTNQREPRWSWASGGNGGTGAYQYKLDNGNLSSGATQVSDTTFVPVANLGHGTHTLYVQERDSAGNWSESGSAYIIIDTIAPSAPVVSATQSSPTNEARPTWTWTGGGGGRGFYRYKIGDTLWKSGGLQGSVAQYRPDAVLEEGARTLNVAEQDSAGNWSASGGFSLTIDVSAPAPTKMDSTPYSPLNALRPTWTWKPGGGGNSIYRCRVDNAELSGGTLVAGTAYSQPSDLSEGRHTLFVQERDEAGNWSIPVSRSILLSKYAAVGNAGLSIGTATVPPRVAFNDNGEIFAAVKDVDNGYSVSVMKLDGSTWKYVGGKALPQSVAGISLAVNSASNPAVAYIGEDMITMVLNFNGINWDTLGFHGGVGSGNLGMELVTNALGDLYLASSGIYFDQASGKMVGGKATVNRYQGGIWRSVGSEWVSDSLAQNTCMSVGAGGKVYVAYADASVGGKATVKALSGNSWAVLGQKGLSAGQVTSLSIKTGNGDIPFLAYIDGGNGSRVSVKRFVDGNWENLGDTAIAVGNSDRVSLAIDKANVPVVSFLDAEHRPCVFKLLENRWIKMKVILPTSSWAHDQMVSLSTDGVPHVIFLDGRETGKATVIRTSYDP